MTEDIPPRHPVLYTMFVALIICGGIVVAVGLGILTLVGP